MQCSNSRLLSSEGSCLLNELNLNNSLIIAHSTSNQLKACSCARSSTSSNSLVFPTLTLVRAILLQAGKAVNNCCFFQFKYNSAFGIFIRKLKAPSFIISIGKLGTFSWVTMRPDSSGLATFTCPYVLIYKRAKLLTEKRTLKASLFFRKQRESESLA